jgi:hypothetical protein
MTDDATKSKEEFIDTLRTFNYAAGSALEGTDRLLEDIQVILDSAFEECGRMYAHQTIFDQAPTIVKGIIALRIIAEQSVSDTQRQAQSMESNLAGLLTFLGNTDLISVSVYADCLQTIDPIFADKVMQFCSQNGTDAGKILEGYTVQAGIRAEQRNIAV